MRFVTMLTSIIISGLIFGAAVSAGAAPQDLDWRLFSNRFGTRVDYPAAIFSQTLASAENGLTLVRADGREPVAYIALYGRIAPDFMAQSGIGTLGVTAVNAPSSELS